MLGLLSSLSCAGLLGSRSLSGAIGCWWVGMGIGLDTGWWSGVSDRGTGGAVSSEECVG